MGKNITIKNIIKHTQAFFAFVFGMHIAPGYSCPTCVGRLSSNSPAFFAQDYTNSQAPEAGASSSRGSAAFLFHQQQKSAVSVPLEFETDAPDTAGATDSKDASKPEAQRPLPTKK